jgi:PHP family Zn ribbon phosphoesterase
VSTIKYACPQCKAKYRLPAEAQGRTAKCKKCGNKFRVPQQDSLEESILDWLSEPDADEETVAQPRIINMPAQATADADAVKRTKGPIRKKAAAETE